MGLVLAGYCCTVRVLCATLAATDDAENAGVMLGWHDKIDFLRLGFPAGVVGPILAPWVSSWCCEPNFLLEARALSACSSCALKSVGETT